MMRQTHSIHVFKNMCAHTAQDMKINKDNNKLIIQYAKNSNHPSGIICVRGFWCQRGGGGKAPRSGGGTLEEVRGGKSRKSRCLKISAPAAQNH